MPGNGVGDSINNFFQQGNLSQGQHQTETVEGSWPGFNNNQWGGHSRQVSEAVSSRNFNAQQSGSDRGRGNWSSLNPYGLNHAESNLRPEIAKSQWQNRQLILNGFARGHQVSPSMQNEANVVGMDTEPAESNLTSRGMFIRRQHISGSPHSNTSSPSFGTKEPATNFVFLGGQQQMNSQQQGILQSLAWQQSGISDAQLLQQQVTLRQMQELQRLQQIQQLGAMQTNTINQISSLSNQAAGNHAPPLINGTPMHEVSNHPWPSQVMAGSPNWLQRSTSPAMLGYANGVVTPPEQGQPPRLMGLIPQQAPQSLYGVPVSNSRSGGAFLMNQVDKTGQVPIQGNFFVNQHPSLTEQMNMHDGINLSRQSFEGKGSFEFTARQGLGDAISEDKFNQMKQRTRRELDGRQDVSVSLAHSLPDQTMKQGASLQAPVALDPTEEKILFGGDNNMWEAFGGSLSGSNGGVSQPSVAFSSLQSGSWSALMQSAVAESSSDDVGLEKEWNGAGLQSSRTLTGNRHPIEEGNERLGYSQPTAIAEEIQSHQSAYFSGEFSSKNTTASWSPQQGTSSSANRFGGLNFIQSMFDGGKTSKEHQEKFQNDSDRAMYANIVGGRHTSSLSADPSSNIEMERQQINSKDDVCISDKNHQREPWRSVDSDVKSGGDGLGMYQQQLNHGMQQVLHSSMNNCDQGITEMPETGNSDRRENSSDSYCSNLSNRASTGGMRKSIWLDAGETHTMSGGKQSSSGQVMVRHLSGMPNGHEGQSTFLGPSTGISPELEKGPLSNFQEDIKASYGMPPNHVNPGQNMLELLQKVDQSKEHSTMANLNFSDHNKLSGTSDTEASERNAAFSPKHSFSQGFGLQLAPPSQGLPAPSFVITSKNLSNTANSPSLSYVASEKGDKSLAWSAPAASVRSSSSVHVAQQVEDQITTSDVRAQVHESFASNAQGDFPASFSSGSLYLKNLLHNQHMADVGGKVNFDQSGSVSFDRKVPHDKQMTAAVPQEQNNQSCIDLSDAQVAIQQMPGNLSSPIPNLYTNMTLPQQLLGSQSHNAAELLKNQFQSNNIPSSSIQQKQRGKDTFKKGDAFCSQSFVGGEEQPLSDRHSDATQKTAVMLQGKETFANPSDVSLSNSAATKKDIEAFGRSLKPSSNTVDNYSLLHQMQAMKEMDPNMRQAKRLKGLDSGPDYHRMAGKSEQSGGLNYADKNESVGHASVSSAVAKMPSFTPETSNDQEKHIQDQHANTTSQDLLSYQDEPQILRDSNMAPRVEHSPVSLQMAPTWFKKYGTFKNGQLLPVHVVQRAQLVANTEQQLTINKSLKDLSAENTLGQANAVVDAGQMANVWQKPPHVPSEHLSSHHALASSVTAPDVASLRPKKRKSATIDLLPWHKEVAMGYQRLPNMSSAEEEWAQAANQLIEKIEDEIDVHEDTSPLVQSRRRLVRTTQLMQQIFCPLPASILSLNASKEFETVAYFAARLALADACSLACQSESDSCVSHDKEKVPSEKPKANDRISDQHLKKVVEQFVSRASILDNELLRLDKRVFVLDLRLESQDLERFSVINRFARFHGRGQVDGAETSSPSDATAALQRARPQRYVNAYPPPKNLPERIQCLSL